jgi:hypothetical protein
MATADHRPQAADLPTLIAIAVIVYALADVLHEGAGHGGACLLTGGRPLALSTVHFECSADNRLVFAGGTIANLMTGIAAWRLLRATRESTHLSYFLWLLMTVNLLQGGGYFLFSGMADIGDWSAFVAGLHPTWVWRVGLLMVGAVLYVAFIWVSIRELLPFVPQASPARWRDARRLTLVPYVAGGLLSCLAGLFNPVGMILVAISAAAASFGGTSGLAWMWQFFKDPNFPTSTIELAPPTRSFPWIVFGAVAAAIFVGLLGPSVHFH